MNFIENHTEEDNNKLLEFIILNEEDLNHSQTVAKDDEIFYFVENNFKRKTIDPLYKHSRIDFGQLTDEEFSKINGQLFLRQERKLKRTTNERIFNKIRS